MISSIAPTHSIQNENIKSDKKASAALQVFGETIFCLTLSLVPVLAIPYGSPDEFWQTIFELAIFIIGVLWLLYGTLTRGWFTAEQMVLLPLIGAVLFAWFQVLPLGGAGGGDLVTTISADPFETRRFAWRVFALITFAAVLFRLTNSVRRLWMLMFVIIGTGFCSALFGLARQTASFTLFGALPYLTANSYGQFINRNHFAFLAEMTLGLTLGLMVGETRRERLPLYAAIATPVWVALIASNSRGGLLGMFSLILVLMLLWNKVREAVKSPHRKRRRSHENFDDRASDTKRRITSVGRKFARPIIVVLMLIGIAFSVVWIGGERLTERVESTHDEVKLQDVTRDGADRRDIWRATSGLIAAHPFAGSGLGAYSLAITKYHDASGAMAVEQAHNDYLELMASGGIIGVSLLLAFVALVAWQARRKLQVAGAMERGATVGALAGMTAIAVHSVVEFGLHTTINAMVFMSLVVIASIKEFETSENASSVNTRKRSTAVRH